MVWRNDRQAFYVMFTHEGRRIQRLIGDSRVEAERVMQDVRRRVQLGSSLSALLNEVFGDVTGHQLTFRDAAPLYLEYAEARKRTSTFRNDVSRLRGLLRAPWATKPLAVVSVADLTAWASRRMTGKRRVSGATVNRDLNLVSALYRWAIGMGYVESNPARSVVRASEKGRARTMWLTVSECSALLAAASEAFRPLLICFLHAGLRRGELLALEWRSVDLDRGVVVIEPESAKSGVARDIPLTSVLAAELQGLAATSPVGGHTPVFRRSGGIPWSAGALRHWLDKTLEAAEEEIPEYRRSQVSLHVLRHTFASHLAQQGVPFHEIAHLLGHSSTYVTARYAHLAPEAGRDAIARLEDRFGDHGSSRVQEAAIIQWPLASTGGVPLAYPRLPALCATAS
ncbi:MAG: site-specific integrase [Planctomycetes bacterium]|nr:site-specific integrase [Planctomycetota bacterium]MCB9830241.1 site-specific integrase [Planctomycetota bacterium]